MADATTCSIPPPLAIEESGPIARRCALRDDAAGAWLYKMDCLEFMDALIERHPQGAFDMIFADPPYFLSNGGITCQSGNMVKVNKGKWDESKGVEANHEFNVSWLSRCQKLLKPNGTIWVSGTQHAIHSVGYAMQRLRLCILNDITWEKPNPPPNLSCRYFTHSTETVIWARKNKRARHVFDYDWVRKSNGNKQMKSVWAIKPPSRREKQFGEHPTQKPIALLERIILASTRVGDLVFDPFAGSSTTGAAAALHGRKFVGCELEGDYIELSRARLVDGIKRGPVPLTKRYKPVTSSVSST